MDQLRTRDDPELLHKIYLALNTFIINITKRLLRYILYTYIYIYMSYSMILGRPTIVNSSRVYSLSTGEQKRKLSLHSLVF